MDQALITAARIMARELEQNRLVVVLLPAPDPQHPGHKVRAVESTNPEWYRRLCARYPKHRHRPRRRSDKYIDSLIDRGRTIAALRRIAAGQNGWVYTQRLMPFVREYAKIIEEMEV